jgi:NADPH-dependent glutamate synthase beta subunit-like oxidoreductase
MNEIVKILVEELPLPLISGWLCLRPDEADKNSPLGKFAEETLKELVEKRYNSDRTAKNSAARVAVVGSGPAGLAAASELVNKGYSVTIFEKSSELGGMLRHGIPSFRLSKSLVDAEIDHLRDSGVAIKANTCVGRDTSITRLFEDGNRAVFLGLGCSIPARLRVEGESLEGVIYAIQFLEELNSGGNPKVGDSVTAIGGGNVGIDAARAVMKLKPQKTQLICPESREEMPSDLMEIARAEKEGLQIHPSCMPRKLLGKDGRVTGIECIKTKPSQYDRNGRFLLVPINGTEFKIEADTVIVAIGQQADLSFLPEKIEVGRGNIIVTDPFTMTTSMKGVFAGGDVVSGPASVLEAIYAGWKVANSIDRYLRSSDAC